MTDQPKPPDSPAAEPDAPSYPPPAQPGPSDSPPPGWSPAPGANAYPPAPPAVAAPPPAAPATPARQPGKWRVAIPLLVIGGFLAFVLWSVRDNQSADDLAAGTCFDVPTETTVSTVTKRPCTEAHDAEVFHNAEYDGESTTYPISLSMDRFVTETCGPVFATYVGEALEDSDLTIGYFYPSFDGWGDGDRTVTCYAGRADGAKLSQSVKAGG